MVPEVYLYLISYSLPPERDDNVRNKNKDFSVLEVLLDYFSTVTALGHTLYQHTGKSVTKSKNKKLTIDIEPKTSVSGHRIYSHSIQV